MKFLLSALLFISLGCQGVSRNQRYLNVQIPSRKGQVLETLGPPNASRRIDGKDHWYYNLRREPVDARRVLIFGNGILEYKGPIPQPRISAEEADRLKEPRPKPQKRKKRGPFQRKYSDSQLRNILKKEVEKQSPKKKKSVPEKL